MTFKELLKEKQITMYLLSKKSGVPFSTISDLSSGKTKPENVRVGHALKLCSFLSITIEEFCRLEMSSNALEFKYFRSNTLHELKRIGDYEFIQKLIREKTIEINNKSGKKKEALYLLALRNYLLRINGMKQDGSKYSKLSSTKLETVLFPGSDLICFENVSEAEKMLGVELIPEFKQFNIVEDSVRNVA